MLNHKAIEKCYESAEFWGYPMHWASEYVEKHLEDFKIKPKETVIKIMVVTKGRGEK